jgi:hypothetical protein
MEQLKIHTTTIPGTVPNPTDAAVAATASAVAAAATTIPYPAVPEVLPACWAFKEPTLKMSWMIPMCMMMLNNKESNPCYGIYNTSLNQTLVLHPIIKFE